MSTKRVIIVGGGYTGLTVAYELSKQPDLSLLLLERSSALGGLAGGFEIQGTNLEKAYHHLFQTDLHVLELIHELGLDENLMWCESSLGIFYQGQIHPFMSPLDLLRFRPCRWTARLRLGLVALYLQKKRNWRPLAGQSAYDWMSRACGADPMRTIWEPLLRGKFDRYFDKVSMAWLWARIHIRANSRKSAGREQLGYLRGGFDRLTQRLESEILRAGARIQTRSTVEAIDLNRHCLTANGEVHPFDACLFTGSSNALARLLPNDTDAARRYKEQLASVVYLGAICVVFVSNQDLGGPYWVNVNEMVAPFLVYLQHTRLVDPSLYRSKHVYYLGAYRPHESAAFQQSDDELVKNWWGYLKRIFPHFDEAQVVERHVFRFENAQHIVDTAYEQRIPDYQTPWAKLYLANFSQIFPEDRGTNYAVREGRNLARRVRQDLQARG